MIAKQNFSFPCADFRSDGYVCIMCVCDQFESSESILKNKFVSPNYSDVIFFSMLSTLNFASKFPARRIRVESESQIVQKITLYYNSR